MRTRIENWYLEHGPALLLFALALTSDRGRAQDALHHVFLKLLESRSLDHIGDARPYLFSALRNTLLNDARQRARLVAMPPTDPAWFHDHPDELVVRLALQGLPEDQREIAVLHVWGGLTFAQAAEVLGISPNTAASRYRYAIEKLRAQLAPKEPHAPR